MRRIVLVLILACLVLVPAATTFAQTGTAYTVQPGDNLFRISLRFGVSLGALAQANNISNANLIFVGQVLQIPAGGTVPATPAPGATPQPGGGQVGNYVVQPGDTLSRIAARFGTTVAAIAQANNIVNPNLIFVGQNLSIQGAPSSGGNPPPSSGGNPPPVTVAGFNVGGQVVGGLAGSTTAAMKTAKMTWVKRQIAAGDGNGPNLIGEAHNAGFKILFSVVGDKNSVTNSGYQDSYANYVGALAQAGADAIEVWNEMNIDREWPTGQISPNSYAALLSKSFNAIKGKNSNTIVISGALSPTGAEGAFGLASVWNDDRYYSGMAAAGVGNIADCIGVHYNEGIVSPLQTSGDPRDNYPTRYFQTMLNRGLAAFPGKKACFTELGYLTPEGYGPLPGGFSWAANTTVAEQAQWLAQAISSAANSGRVSMVIVFNIDSTNYGTDPQAGYAIIRPGGGCPGCNSIGAVLP